MYGLDDVEALNRAAFARPARRDEAELPRVRVLRRAFRRAERRKRARPRLRPAADFEAPDRSRAGGRRRSGDRHPQQVHRPRISCLALRFRLRPTGRRWSSRMSRARCFPARSMPGSSSTKTASPTRPRSAENHRSRRALGTADRFPIPLGGFVARRALPAEVIVTVSRIFRRSVEFAFANPGASLPFVREHAQEMSEEVMSQHIRLYVNVYSIELGVDGRRAVNCCSSVSRTGADPRDDRAAVR